MQKQRASVSENSELLAIDYYDQMPNFVTQVNEKYTGAEDAITRVKAGGKNSETLTKKFKLVRETQKFKQEKEEVNEVEAFEEEAKSTRTRRVVNKERLQVIEKLYITKRIGRNRLGSINKNYTF